MSELKAGRKNRGGTERERGTAESQEYLKKTTCQKAAKRFFSFFLFNLSVCLSLSLSMHACKDGHAALCSLSFFHRGNGFNKRVQWEVLDMTDNAMD